MTPEKEKILYETFPDVYRERSLPPSRTCMCRGICCDDGWFDILHDLCSCLARIQKASGIGIVAKQVKEKFAGLRFYYSIEIPDDLPPQENKEWTNIISAVVSAAENKSSRTCEVTGKWGSLCINSRGYYKTLSADKAKELEFIECKDGEL